MAVSLTLRTLDEPLREAVSVGTHFLWHVLNAVVLFLVSMAVIRHPVGRIPPREADTER